MKDTHFIFVIVGATGDLTYKKISPALYTLFLDRKLPEKFSIISFARRNMTNEQYKEYLAKRLKERLGFNKVEESFFENVQYVQGDFKTKDPFKNLEKVIDKLIKNDKKYKIIFYLAIPQDLYYRVAKKVDDIKYDNSNLRLVFEKPFGLNHEEANKLDNKLKKHFDEEIIYRIDHYLGKALVINIVDFRYENALIDSLWQPENITKIKITTNETAGVEDRGEFYETVGALKDVGQNHLLEILALIIGDIKTLKKDIHKGRIEVLNKLPIMSKQQIKENTYRAQYIGYRDIEDVDKKSNIETYFKIKTYINDDKWKHIPIIIEAGKGLRRNDKKLTVFFKDNTITIKLFPDALIEFGVNLNINGHQSCEKFIYQLQDDKYQYIGEYANLFLELFQDKKDNFVTIEEIKAQWSFIDPIINAWKQDVVKLDYYEKGETPDSNII